MTIIPALLALAVMPTLSLAQAQSGVTLASLRHDYRPLLVFAPGDNEKLHEQMKEFVEQKDQMHDRQVLLVPVVIQGAEETWDELPQASIARLTSEEETAARRRFRVGKDEFAVILIGKDGGEKLRSSNPVTMEKFIRVIDAMPMRQKETRDGHSG